jgi:hypothetical protein
MRGRRSATVGVPCRCSRRRRSGLEQSKRRVPVHRRLGDADRAGSAIMNPQREVMRPLTCGDTRFAVVAG